ncbi:cyclin-A2-1-like [Cynara cardunculus var. scolymus]|uniref:cyclin-A2-1-like n=1 Tax=Cynara cardunculus var. scolymus TaxID=59895 RepID=UPI000D62F4F8|nr:cyclin-A2-1-like [Cynara cardunculus var. scolymus]
MKPFSLFIRKMPLPLLSHSLSTSKDLGAVYQILTRKYKEISAPRVEDLCFITDDTYTRQEVLDMELQVMDILSFHLSVPTVKKFLRRFILAAQSSYKHQLFMPIKPH